MRFASLLVLVLLSGCADTPAPAEPAEDLVAEPTEDPVEAPPAPTEPTPTERVTNASWDGRTATAVCVPAACRLLQQPEGSWTELDALAPGTMLRARGTLTWTAQTPLTEELRLFVFGLAQEGPPASGVELRGPSPLSFDVDLSALPGVGHAFSIHGHHEAGPVLAETAQPFRMEVELVSLA